MGITDTKKSPKVPGLKFIENLVLNKAGHIPAEMRNADGSWESGALTNWDEDRFEFECDDGSGMWGTCEDELKLT